MAVEYPGEHRYRIRSTGESSSRYGNCEVCGQRVSETFIQAHEERVIVAGEEHWCCRGGAFGHEECLRGVREPNAVET